MRSKKILTLVPIKSQGYLYNKYSCKILNDMVKAIGGGLGVFSQILLILAYVGSPTYLVSKMGSLSSQLRTVVEI